MNISKSEKLFEQAKAIIPGGVNSPVRAFKSVGGTPIFFERGEGSKVYDVDGNEYIDYIGSWGPHILGHSPAIVKDGLHKAIETGVSFGAPTSIEVAVADLIISMVPSIEMVRMVNSGTEATMSAIRLARGYTGRDKVIKFEGCYHGHADSFLIKAGSGALTFGMPTSPGVTKGTAADTLIADYNSIESVQSLIENNKGQIAAIIIEPIAGNMGVVEAERHFLEYLRAISSEEGIVLIFDEVMTGFRVAAGGAQSIYGITPDITTFGKIIGGGLPVGCFGGKKEIMLHLAPVGPVYQAGTLSGNPLAMQAGYEVLSYLNNNPDIYNELECKSGLLAEGFEYNLKKLGKKYAINRVGSMMCMFFTEQEVNSYKTATASDTALYAKFFHSMLNQGIYFAPAQYEALFISIAHSEQDLVKTIDAQLNALKELV